MADSTTPTTEATKLWCLHVTGADDVHPMPSREVALEEANALNTALCRIKREDYDPALIAVVTEWPHSADSHAAGLLIREEALSMRQAKADELPAPQPREEAAEAMATKAPEPKSSLSPIGWPWTTKVL